MRIQSFGTKGLFGIFDHHVELKNDERLTLIHGPNGFGKTTLLRLLREFFAGRFSEFGKTPLTSFYINFDDKRTITVTKIDAPDAGAREYKCLIRMDTPNAKTQEEVVSAQDYNQFVADEMAKRAPYMQNLGQDLWEDARDGELLDTEELAERFGIRHLLKKKSEQRPEWLTDIIGSISVRLIETQRLVLQRKPRPHFTPRHQPRSTETVMEYSQQLAGKIQSQFNDYARVSAQLDRTFVVRLLKLDFGLHETMPGNTVSEKVENLNEKRRRLMESGLLSRDEEAIPSPEAPNSAIDQILNAYLQDVESKLAVFDTLLERIEVLKRIVDAHLEYKKMVISQQFGFQFRTTYGKHSRILPTSLSSGEQHILILFYDLLFNDAKSSLILIDEPEISLHVDWQLSFLSDLQKIISIVPHDIVLATHSPQIVNNHWELTVPLNRPEGAEA